MKLEGKRAIVTGAASGIGRAVALRLAEEGAIVFIGDRNEPGVRETAAEIGKAAHPYAFDVSDPDSCAGFVAAAAEWLGGLDLLCNIAGILDMTPFDEISAERWATTLGVNLSGVFYMCQLGMPHLIASKGAIVNMASVASLIGMNNSSSYCASKHGVLGLTKALAVEVASRGVRVNAICPGAVNTPLLQTAAAAAPQSTPPRARLNGEAMCDPRDIADAVVFLASSEARRVTGIALPVDGGHTAG